MRNMSADTVTIDNMQTALATMNQLAEKAGLRTIMAEDILEGESDQKETYAASKRLSIDYREDVLKYMEAMKTLIDLVSCDIYGVIKDQKEIIKGLKGNED